MNNCFPAAWRRHKEWVTDTSHSWRSVSSHLRTAHQHFVCVYSNNLFRSNDIKEQLRFDFWASNWQSDSWAESGAPKCHQGACSGGYAAHHCQDQKTRQPLGFSMLFKCQCTFYYLYIYIALLIFACFSFCKLSIDRNWTYPAGLVALKFLVACCHYWQSISTGSKLAVNWQLQNDPRRFDANCNQMPREPESAYAARFQRFEQGLLVQTGSRWTSWWTYHIKLYIYTHYITSITL